MSVYVDDASHKLGAMTMCHMMADTPEELRAMAEMIGVSVRWIQRKDTPAEHLDVSRPKRELAVENGAIEITQREMASMRAERKRINAEAMG